MRKSHHDSYEQAYNAQAVVDAGGSQMILATDVIRTPSDANQLEAALKGVTEIVGTRGADAGRWWVRERRCILIKCRRRLTST